MTEGGQGNFVFRKLSDKNIEEIIKFLLETNISFKTLSEKYKVSISCISNINTGRTWKDNKYIYPLRKSNERSILNK